MSSPPLHWLPLFQPGMVQLLGLEPLLASAPAQCPLRSPPANTASRVWAGIISRHRPALCHGSPSVLGGGPKATLQAASRPPLPPAALNSRGLMAGGSWPFVPSPALLTAAEPHWPEMLSHILCRLCLRLHRCPTELATYQALSEPGLPGRLLPTLPPPSCWVGRGYPAARGHRRCA